MAKVNLNFPSFTQILQTLFVILIAGGTTFFSLQFSSDGPIWDKDTTVDINVGLNENLQGVRTVPEKQAIAQLATPGGYNKDEELIKIFDYTVVVRYGVMKLIVPNGKTFEDLVKEKPEFYYETVGSVTYSQENPPTVDDALGKMQLNPDQTQIIGVQLFKHNPRWVSKPIQLE